MVLTKDIWLPSEAELTVEEVPLGTPSLRAGAMHLGKVCEVQNNEFMLCRSETQDPRWVVNLFISDRDSSELFQEMSEGR